MKIVRAARPSSSSAWSVGYFGPAAGKPSEDLLRFGGAEPERGGVFDELIVLLGDQLPADRAGKDLLEPGVA